MTERGKKIREAFMKKYGVAHPSQLQSVKDKIKKKRLDGAYDSVVEKMRTTKLKRYGDPNFGNVDKGKKTKLDRYGNATYNNRQKMIETNLQRYGQKVSPRTVESTIRRNKNGTAGFGGAAYATFLTDHGIENVSQLPSVKQKKRMKNLNTSYDGIVSGARLRGKVIPRFSREEYSGTEYEKTYEFECSTCHNIFYDHLYSGNIPRCLKCHPHDRFTSIGQNEIADFIRSLGYSVVMDDRNILNGLEVDILVDEKKLCIEFDGIYWHSELSGNKPREYHLGKTTECLAKGYDLLHIFDSEWESKKDIIKSIILMKLGKGVRRLFARQCEVRNIDTSTCISFLEKNHMQGGDRASIRLGLFHKEELVSVMTFCKSRYDKTYEYEMSRFCTTVNVQIVGGTSKLFTYFIRHYQPKSIVSYSDKRFFTGKTYTSIGMIEESNTPPSYFYTKNGAIVGTRQTFQKHKLSKILPTFDPNLTEWENMQRNGFDRIWDCGHSKYIWKKQ